MVTNILLRLDAKTLVGFKSVSKIWLALISSTHFAKSHLAITSAVDKQEEIHIVRAYTFNRGTMENSISLINLGTRQLITRVNFPLNQCSSFTIVDSACGIVCISYKSGEVCKYYLWNPATNFSKLVPSLPLPDDSDALCVGSFGFGFDEINNDFKIVRVLWRMRHSEEYFDHSPRNCDKVYVDVYSSKRNVWRQVEQEGKTIDDICYDLCCFDVTVSGGLLCCVGCYGISTFDLHTEVLNSPAINYPIPTLEYRGECTPRHQEENALAYAVLLCLHGQTF